MILKTLFYTSIFPAISFSVGYYVAYKEHINSIPSCPSDSVVIHQLHDRFICEQIVPNKRPLGKRILTTVDRKKSWTEMTLSRLTLNSSGKQKSLQHSTDGAVSQ
jgi:hypothetical protein